jgi:hypothetical protein
MFGSLGNKVIYTSDNFLFQTQLSDVNKINAIKTLISDLKLNNLLHKFSAIYPFVSDGILQTRSFQHKFNLINPKDTDKAFRLSFMGTVTHNDNGVTGDGTSGYANSFFNSSLNLAVNSTHISVYSRTNINRASQEIAAGGFSIITKYNNAVTYIDSYNGSTGRVTVTVPNSLGLFMSSRTSATVHKAFKNGYQIGTTNTGASGSLSPSNMNIMAGSPPGNYSNKNIAFASIGSGMTDAESLTFYNIVQAFQTTLGRQV